MNRNHTTKIRKASKEKGFTLLEVIIAVSVLTFGLLAVASMQATAIRGNYLSGNLTGASTLAGDRVEKLLSMGYSDADLDVGDHSNSRDLYTISWNVAQNAAFNNTKTVNVTVSWTERGSQKTLVMQGIKAR